jgi:hypothetical protein
MSHDILSRVVEGTTRLVSGAQLVSGRRRSEDLAQSDQFAQKS